MVSITPGLAGHKGLRGEVLVEIKKCQPVTAKELATSFGVSANAVRRHLKELESAGLVEYALEHRGSGAPAYTFRLSEEGEQVFPKKYGEVLTDVLGVVARGLGRDAVKQIFAQRFREYTERIRTQRPNGSLEEKVEAVAALLTDQGYMADWSSDAEGLTLAKHNCALRAVAEAFPEICEAEAEFLSEVLQAEVRRDESIPEGCNACLYSISRRASNGAANPTASQGEEEVDNE